MWCILGRLLKATTVVSRVINSRRRIACNPTELAPLMPASTVITYVSPLLLSCLSAVHSQYSQANRTSQSLRSAPRPAPPLMSTQSLQQQPPANHDDDDIQISAVVPPSPAKKTVAPSSAAPAKIPSKAVARSHAAKDSLVVSTSPRPMLRRPAAGGDPATTSAVQDRQPATTEPKSTTSPTKPSAVSSHGTPTKTSDQELSPTKKSARTPLQFGKRSVLSFPCNLQVPFKFLFFFSFSYDPSYSFWPVKRIQDFSICLAELWACNVFKDYLFDMFRSLLM